MREQQTQMAKSLFDLTKNLDLNFYIKKIKKTPGLLLGVGLVIVLKLQS